MPSDKTDLPSLTTLLLAKVPSDWSIAHPSITNLLLDKPPSHWSTAHPSLTTSLLGQMPSHWSTAHQSLITFLLDKCHLGGQQLFLVLLPTYWLKHPLIGQRSSESYHPLIS